MKSDGRDRRSSAEWLQRDRVWSSALATREKLVLLAFLDCDRAGKGRELYPSMERIAWQSGLANSTVRLAVDELQRLGVLARSGHVRSLLDARGRVAKFIFAADRLPTRPIWSANSRREPAPVDAEQPPDDNRTAAGCRQNSRRMTETQPPAAGADRTYVNVQGNVRLNVQETGAIAPALPDDEDFKVYAAIACRALDESIREDCDDSIANVSERFKRLCAQQRKRYTAEITRKAVAAAFAKRDKARADYEATAVRLTRSRA
jgi:hypothetical protein